MQLVFNVKTTVALAVVAAGSYYCYRTVFADVGSRDIPTLIRAHRRADPARQLLLKRRILAIYEGSRDYPTLVNALDSPSATTRALAVEVLTEKGERRAAPKLLVMLEDPGQSDTVKESLAKAVAALGLREAIPRLVELADVAESDGVRAAAHNALERLTGAGGQVKLSKAARQHWTLWLRNNTPSALNR